MMPQRMDADQKQALKETKRQVDEVVSVMRNNIEMVLERGDKLENLSAMQFSIPPALVTRGARRAVDSTALKCAPETNEMAETKGGIFTRTVASQALADTISTSSYRRNEAEEKQRDARKPIALDLREECEKTHKIDEIAYYDYEEEEAKEGEAEASNQSESVEEELHPSEEDLIFGVQTNKDLTYPLIWRGGSQDHGIGFFAPARRRQQCAYVNIVVGWHVQASRNVVLLSHRIDFDKAGRARVCVFGVFDFAD
jgi:hypothetical protein